jgi:hypothetical protein
MAGMREMWSETRRGGAIADLREVYRQAGRNRWWFLALAGLTTLGLFSVMAGQSWKKKRALPEITYVNLWPAHRSDAETKAFIAENQRRKEAREAAVAKAQEEERAIYKALGRASGMDVETMDKRGAEERAREAAAEKARNDAILKANVRD